MGRSVCATTNPAFAFATNPAFQMHSLMRYGNWSRNVSKHCGINYRSASNECIWNAYVGSLEISDKTIFKILFSGPELFRWPNIQRFVLKICPSQVLTAWLLREWEVVEGHGFDRQFFQRSFRWPVVFTDSDAGATVPCFSPNLGSIWRTTLPCPQVTSSTKRNIILTGREEEWQFPAQIMPVVRDTVAHAGFKITKVKTKMPCPGILMFYQAKGAPKL